MPSIRKTIGGDRLGSGRKLQVELHNYGRSTHDLGYIWRTTMSPGTLVPFMKQLALPGDTWDISLDADVKTHPTIGPLFGSFKLQLDVFFAPIRLYQGKLHNNQVGLGLDMANVKLPKLALSPIQGITTSTSSLELDQYGTEPSSLLNYLGVKGTGVYLGAEPPTNKRKFNAVPLLAYWDIFKNYYANKQEENARFINVTMPTVDVTSVVYHPAVGVNANVPEYPSTADSNDHIITAGASSTLEITFDDEPTPDDIDRVFVVLKYIPTGAEYPLEASSVFSVSHTVTNTTTFALPLSNWSDGNWMITAYIFNPTPGNYSLQIDEFPLSNLDDIRNEALLYGIALPEFVIDDSTMAPFGDICGTIDVNGDDIPKYRFKQHGLALKTYQSDIFNIWMNAETFTNVSTGINAITAINTSGGSFTIDTLILSKKVYEMLNRIAISGGTYQDWIETVYTADYVNRTEIPIYEGGLSKEIVFQEVVSLSGNPTEQQPLGTLAGKGTLGRKHKGGEVYIKVDEPGYIIGIVSITPRVDYSQGNDWDVNLDNMDDLHKPALDEIGFQDLVTDSMAWWSTAWENNSEKPVYQSAGKVPAWLWYMTNINRTHGNFANPDEQMFMTINRRYTSRITGNAILISDLTTYIDPTKYNFIFADVDISAQNFWVQIANDITVRRKMSAKVMPNL